MSYDAEKYKELCELFDKVCKRIEVYKSRKLTTNPDKVKAYKQDLVNTYNNLLIFLIPYITSIEDKIAIQNRIVTHHKRLKECFQILQFEYSFEHTIHALIDLDRITETRDLNPNPNRSPIPPTSPNKNIDSDSSTSSTNTVIDKSIEKTTNSTSTERNGAAEQQQIPPRQRANSSNSENSDSDSDIEMAQSAKNLMQLATSTINYKFEGDPMKLDSFIDAIELLEELCEPQNTDILLKFLMTKLEGKAREAIAVKPKKIEEIKTQLKDAIKTESSKVIEGRISALRADKMSMTKFAERAEELVENYRRSLISEGFTKEKAKQFAIEKTVDLCRNSAVSPIVVSILGAATFSEPKEVIARMITEINKLKGQKSILNNRKNDNNRNGNGHSNNKFHKNNNGNSHSNSNSNNNRNGNGNGNGNGNNRQNNGNGRQNYQNQGNRNDRNGNQSRTFTNSNYRRTNDSQQVRYISGNEIAPGNGGQPTNTNQ